MHPTTPITGNDLDNLFATGSNFNARKSLVNRELNTGREAQLMEIRLSPKEAGIFMHKHFSALQRYVHAGKGWGAFDQAELLKFANLWKSLSDMPSMGGKFLKRLSKSWVELEKLEHLRLANDGYLGGSALVAWRHLNKDVRKMGFRLVLERPEWHQGERPMLQFIRSFMFRETFPHAPAGLHRPEMYLCRGKRSGRYAVVARIPALEQAVTGADKQFDWENESLVLN